MSIPAVNVFYLFIIAVRVQAMMQRKRRKGKVREGESKTKEESKKRREGYGRRGESGRREESERRGEIKRRAEQSRRKEKGQAARLTLFICERYLL